MSDKEDQREGGDGAAVASFGEHRRDEVLSSDPTLEARLQLAVAASMAPAVPEHPSLLSELRAAADRVEEAVVVESRTRSGAAAKRAVHQLTSWYHQQLLRRHRDVDEAVMAVLQQLEQRIGLLEVRDADDVLGGRPEVLLATPDGLGDQVGEAVVEALLSANRPSGRVLHAEAAGGDLVRSLLVHGLDAYGVDPWLPPPGGATEDVWQVGLLDHLRTVPHGSLDAIVLSGHVDTADTAERLDVLTASRRGLSDGGVLVIATETASSDARRARGGRRDLRPGRPFDVATWQRLLALHGLSARAPVRAAGQEIEVDILVATPTG